MSVRKLRQLRDQFHAHARIEERDAQLLEDEDCFQAADFAHVRAEVWHRAAKAIEEFTREIDKKEATEWIKLEASK